MIRPAFFGRKEQTALKKAEIASVNKKIRIVETSKILPNVISLKRTSVRKRIQKLFRNV
jgi:hypothetical protein